MLSANSAPRVRAPPRRLCACRLGHGDESLVPFCARHRANAARWAAGWLPRGPVRWTSLCHCVFSGDIHQKSYMGASARGLAAGGPRASRFRECAFCGCGGSGPDACRTLWHESSMRRHFVKEWYNAPLPKTFQHPGVVLSRVSSGFFFRPLHGSNMVFWLGCAHPAQVLKVASHFKFLRFSPPSASGSLPPALSTVSHAPGHGQNICCDSVGSVTFASSLALARELDVARQFCWTGLRVVCTGQEKPVKAILCSC